MSGLPRFPYEEFRRGQRELAEAVADTVRSNGVLVIRAPTGYGKTAAVVYGLLLAGVKRILYAVRTVNEIDPVLRELRVFGARHSFLFSARRSCPLMYKPGLPPLSHEDFWSNCAVLRFKGLCEYYSRLSQVSSGDLESFIREYPLPSAFKMALDMGRGLRVCPFFALLRISGGSEFTVATYPYLFREDIFTEVFEGFSYGDFIVVVDEAHSLLNAHSLLESRVSLSDLEGSIREIRRYAPHWEHVAERLESIVGELGGFFRRKWKGLRLLDKSLVVKLLGDVGEIGDVEAEIRERLLLEALASGLGDFRVSLKTAKVARWAESLENPNYELFATVEGEEPTIISTPLDPHIAVDKPLSQAKALILLSGTIPPGDFLGTHLGVKRQHTLFDVELSFGAFMPRSNVYTVVAADVTTRFKERGPHTYHRIAGYVTEISRGLNGVKLVVYPSYEVMHSVVERLPGDLELIVETPATNLGDVEARIMEGGDVTINAVAGGKLVEGVEFVDYEGRNMLHIAVIVGLPFPQPDDYTKRHLEALAKRIGSREARNLVYIVATAIKVRQALGRAVRSPEDKAAYILLDYRFLRKDIKQVVGLKYDNVTPNVETFKREIGKIRKHLATITENKPGEQSSTLQ
ncbi:MAG: ATP-dependent DNA helicase [Thermoprotei archaeon]|nr:ATP-dependent DNA helicase [Thermoprotei archaeon]